MFSNPTKTKKKFEKDFCQYSILLEINNNVSFDPESFLNSTDYSLYLNKLENFYQSGTLVNYVNDENRRSTFLRIMQNESNENRNENNSNNNNNNNDNNTNNNNSNKKNSNSRKNDDFDFNLIESKLTKNEKNNFVKKLKRLPGKWFDDHKGEYLQLIFAKLVRGLEKYSCDVSKNCKNKSIQRAMQWCLFMRV